MSHSGSQDEIALGFRYEFRVQGSVAMVRLLPKARRQQRESRLPSGILVASPPASDEDQNLEIRVVPRTSAVSQEIFGVLRDWVSDIQAPRWQQWLLQLRPLARVALVILLVVGTLAYIPRSPSATDYKETYKREARKMLQDGINQRNETKAIELLLSLQTDYVPPGAKASHSEKSVVTFLIWTFVLGVFSFTPSVCLAIWKGKRRLRWWRQWIKFNYFTVPGLLITEYLWPRLLSAIEIALRH